MDALYRNRYKLLFFSLFMLLASAGYMVVRMHDETQASRQPVSGEVSAANVETRAPAQAAENTH